AGQRTTTTQAVTVTATTPAPPTASFVFSPAAPHVGNTVQFNASASTGAITSYQWDFGDGTFATTTSPTTSHVYTSAAGFNVTLTVTSASGQSGTKTNTVTVLP